MTTTQSVTHDTMAGEDEVVVAPNQREDSIKTPPWI